MTKPFLDIRKYILNHCAPSQGSPDYQEQAPKPFPISKQHKARSKKGDTTQDHDDDNDDDDNDDDDDDDACDAVEGAGWKVSWRKQGTTKLG